MSNSNAQNKIAIALIFAATGCATNAYRPIPSEPLKVATDSMGQTPKDIVADAYTIHRSSLFDMTTAKRIEKAVKDAKDDRAASIAVRDIVCNGEKPRVKVSLRFHLILNKPIPSTPVDVVAQKNQLLVSEVPFYLKAYWLHEASRPELLDKQINSDFDEYYRAVVETNGERKTTNRIDFGIPFLPGSSKADVERFFANTHAVPTLKRLADKGPVEWYPSRSLISIETGPQDYILSNKVANIFSGVVGEGIEQGEIYINTDVQFEATTTVQRFSQQDGWQFRTYANFTVSPNTWKLDDGTTAHPMQLNVLNDLAQLRRLFAFRIPMGDLEKMFGVTSETERLFGYSDGKFSAETALEYADYTWLRTLEYMTEVQSTVMNDASTTLSVRPSMELFCRWAVPTSSLRTSN